MRIFWKNVRRILDYRKINLRMLATLAGVPYSTIINGKNKKLQPSIKTASKIASALNEPLDSPIYDTARLRTDRAVLKLKNSFRKNDIALYRKYESIIAYLEKLPVGTRESIINLILTVAGRNTDLERESKKLSTKEHTAHYVTKNDD